MGCAFPSLPRRKPHRQFLNTPKLCGPNVLAGAQQTKGNFNEIKYFIKIAPFHPKWLVKKSHNFNEMLNSPLNKSPAGRCSCSAHASINQ